MERTIQLEEHYGAVVWTHIEMDTARKTECLCRLCDRLKPGQALILSLFQNGAGDYSGAPAAQVLGSVHS